MDQKYLRVGKIINTHGLKGEIKVEVYTDFPNERFAVNNSLYVGLTEGGVMTEIIVTDVWSHKQFYILKFKNYNNIDQVQQFLNQYIWISSEEQHELEENAYYYNQIIGCNVETVTGESIGTVTDIMETGANDVWVIKRLGQPSLLIPYIEDVVVNVDCDQKKILINPLAGLLE